MSGLLHIDDMKLFFTQEQIDQVIAQGIREAKQYAMDEKPSVECEYENYCNFVNLIDEYADKLEKGDE